MKLKEPLFRLALLSTLVGCSGPMVRTKHDRSVHFEDLHTYSWQTEGGNIGPGLSKDTTLDTRIRSAIDSTLQAKGLRSVPEKDADLRLQYEASAKEEVDATYLKNYATAEFMGLTHTLGALKLTMVLPVSPTAPVPVVAWQGSVYANIDAEKTPQERDAKLREAIQTLLKKFPPK